MDRTVVWIVYFLFTIHPPSVLKTNGELILLQLNLLQQSHLIQNGDKKKSSGALQQLAAQQHQLMQQLQLTQRQYLIQQGLSLPSMVMPGGNGGNSPCIVFLCSLLLLLLWIGVRQTNIEIIELVFLYLYHRTVDIDSFYLSFHFCFWLNDFHCVKTSAIIVIKIKSKIYTRSRWAMIIRV